MELMIIPSIIATGVLTIPSLAGKFALHDMWMTPILGSLTGFITVYTTWKLHQLFPKMTPVQYAEKILGKVLGWIFSFIIVFFYIHNTGLVIRQYSDFISGNVMLQTPTIIFSITIMFVSALAVRGGLEVIARSAVIATTLFLITSVTLVFLLKDIDITYMLPILENGFIPVLKGSFIYNSWFSEFFLLAFLFPFLNHPEKGLRSGMKASLYVMLLLLMISFFVLTMLGESMVNQFYPVYSIVRGIKVLGFFENFEVIITASWVLGNFIKVSVFLYVASLGLAQLFKLSDYRFIVFPLSLLIVFFSYLGIPNIVNLIDYMATVQPFYFVITQTILPLFLLALAVVRGKRRKKV